MSWRRFTRLLQTTVGTLWSALREAQLLTFLVMRCQSLPGIDLRQVAGPQESRRSRDGNDDGLAQGNLRLGPRVNCYSARAFRSEAPRWSALIAATAQAPG
jgi:hypothetical protein